MKRETQQDYQERMLRVLVYIQRNLDQSPTLEELAAVAHFSPFHFHRIFRGMTGESLHAHLRRLKLEKAASVLRQTDDPVLRIALDSGFESHPAFTRAFKDLMGCSPTEWRTAPKSTLPNFSFSGPSDLLSQREGDHGMNVEIVKENEVRVAFVRHTGPYNLCGSAWGKLCGRLGPEGRLGRSPFIGLSYDDPDVTPADKIRYDACVEVDETFKPAGDIGVQVLSGGSFAKTTHLGPYDNLKDTYAVLVGQWLPHSGRRYLVGPTREIYRNDPEATAPADLITDIYLPLED